MIIIKNFFVQLIRNVLECEEMYMTQYALIIKIECDIVCKRLRFS